MSQYPKRLIEVDLPIQRISAHARREKSIRHGHISTLHIWWARRPLAACRAVLCAALWPDPADELCPSAFRETAARLMQEFALTAARERAVADLCHPMTWGKLAALRQPEGSLDPGNPAHLNLLRYLLLDFIADFANWDASTEPHYLATARALTQAAHEALGGAPGTRPLVVDPFAGGGSIPLEALRIGADAFASDLNPVAMLLNKVVLEYIPKYGQRLADEVRKWGQWIKEQAEKELAEFYPKDPDGATPIAYLWARTIRCEGPGCGAEVPLMRSLWLAKRGERSVALRLLPDRKAKRVDFEIIRRRGGGWVSQADPKRILDSPRFDGTVARGSATCPVCGYTTPVASVRAQLKARRGGAADARLFCVVTTRPGQQGRFYRLPTKTDLEAVARATVELESRKREHRGPLSLVPDEPLDTRGIRHTWAMIYGLENWGDSFTPRQALALTVLVRLVAISHEFLDTSDPELVTAIQTVLALALDRQADYGSSLCRWVPTGEFFGNTFGRQAVPLVWDFAEASILSVSTGGFAGALEWVTDVCKTNAASAEVEGHAAQGSATCHSLPDDAAAGLATDPPYYDAVPYAYLSDFFYVWLRRTLGDVHPDLLQAAQVPKDAEIVVDRPHHLSQSKKDVAFYERELTGAFAEGRRVLQPGGIGAIVFASKTTASWEAFLKAVLDAGFVISASWPVDTEMAARIAAQGQARLGSSIHLVCRPRETARGALDEAAVGEWRDVLDELPRRIHDWMPRLAREGVVGADAIFACLGPALEIYSRYSRVERADGTAVPLGDRLDAKGQVLERGYLSYVWEAVSKEALSMIFAGADTAGFEADARLTAMWLWTLSASPSGGGGGERAEDEGEEEEEAPRKKALKGGYVLEYDAARKIAQGLGAHLEQMGALVEVKGDQARLLPVAERARALFGKEGPAAPRRRRQGEQLSLFAVEAAAEPGPAAELGAPAHGATVLDRVHQAMLLFAAGRGEALRRFLVEEGAGQEARFWRLAQALSALYPARSDEKRWVDGVLARKKGLGL